MPPIFEWQIASYDRPPSGDRFENLSLRSVQIRDGRAAICQMLPEDSRTVARRLL